MRYVCVDVERAVGRCEPIDADLRSRMRTSHRPGCPVPLRDLRYLRMTHRDLDGRARTGEMVVHRRWARGVTEAFGELYDAVREIGQAIHDVHLSVAEQQTMSEGHYGARSAR